MSAYNENSVTKKEIWEQIKQLQDQLMNLKEVLFQMNCVEHVADENTIFDAEVARAKIDGMAEIVNSREHSVRQMLQFYIDLYSKTGAEKPAE